MRQQSALVPRAWQVWTSVVVAVAFAVLGIVTLRTGDEPVHGWIWLILAVVNAVIAAANWRRRRAAGSPAAGPPSLPG